MRQLFTVPWLSSGGRIALSILCPATLVCGVFGLLKVSIGEQQAPNKELTTGSIQRSPAVRKPESRDPMAAFLTPAVAQSTSRAVTLQSNWFISRPCLMASESTCSSRVSAFSSNTVVSSTRSAGGISASGKRIPRPRDKTPKSHSAQKRSPRRPKRSRKSPPIAGFLVVSGKSRG
jgi:hypothetical protein